MMAKFNDARRVDAGETLDCTTGELRGATIMGLVPIGVLPTCEARWRGNTGVVKRDFGSANYSGTGASARELGGYTPGDFDRLRVATGSVLALLWVG